MLTKENLLWEKPFIILDSIERLYRYENGYGLSVISTPTLMYQWDIAIYKNISEDGEERELVYGCGAEIPNDIETEEEVNDFIVRAGEFLSKLGAVC